MIGAIRPGEGRRTALLFAQLFLSAAIFLLGRTVRDTLFLSRFPLKWLPWMFVAYGIVSAATVAFYARVADRIPRDRAIVRTCIVGVATYLGVWIAVQAGASWIYPVFYPWSEVISNLLIVQFWTLANDLHDPRSARRLFGIIGSARVLGGTAVGLGAGAVVRLIGTAQLLFVLAAMAVAVALLAHVLGQEPRAEGAARPGHARRRGRGAPVLADAYVRCLAGITLLGFVALTVGDYQFKLIARSAYREDDLARFFGLFYAAAGAVAFFFQILATPRVLARFGVGAGMSVMPTFFGGASLALLAAPRLALASVMKFADNGFQYTIHETTQQALYVPFPPEAKARTRMLLDGAVKPAAYAVGGVALALLSGRVPVHWLVALTLPLVLVWLSLVPMARRLYQRRLEATLSARGALALEHEPLLDGAGRRALLRALEQGDPRQALVALEQLSAERPPELAAHLERLATHADARLRAAALRYMAETPGCSAGPARGALSDREAEVRAAAAETYGTLAGDEAVSVLAPLIEGDAREVRVSALASVLRHGGIEGSLAGSRRLDALLGSAQAEDRVDAARVLGRLGRGAYGPLARLLSDADGGVRRAALRAAEGLADPRFVPLFIRGLGEPGTRRRAAGALASVGPPAAPALYELLEDPATPRVVKLLVPRVLRRIPLPETYDRLRWLTAASDSHLRLRVLAALSHLRRSLKRPAEPLGFVQRLVQLELADTYANLAGWEAARGTHATPLLSEVFQFRQDRAVRRILRVLELRYPPEPLALVREFISDPRRRANALEVLDTILEGPLRPLIMPFLDDVPVAERLRRAGPLAPPPPSPLEFMGRQCAHPNPYVALLALDALARRSEPGAAPFAREALRHADPLVREGGVRALAACDPAAAGEELRPLLHDPDPVVSRQARGALARLAGEPEAEVPMYGTVEKILLLKSAPVFARVSADDLAPLARVAEVETYAAGTTVFGAGEMGDSLYVIVRGRVAIEGLGHRIATLGSGEAFGEMSVLDASPRSATATAEEETEVLRIGSEEFYEVLHEQVEIAEGVIRMLTHRLRETDAALARERASGSSA